MQCRVAMHDVALIQHNSCICHRFTSAQDILGGHSRSGAANVSDRHTSILLLCDEVVQQEVCSKMVQKYSVVNLQSSTYQCTAGTKHNIITTINSHHFIAIIHVNLH